VQAYDNDRFVCALFAPHDRREDLLAVLAFNSEIARIRETVREPMLGEIRLQWWRETLDAVFAGHAPRHEVAEALQSAVIRRGLPRAPFDRLIEGRSRDLYDEEPDTLAGLLAYVGETAHPIAALELAALGVDDPGPMEPARDVAVAFALTGLLRSIRHHARAGRLYLPKDVMARAGLSRRAVLDGKAGDGKAGDALTAATREIADVARSHLGAARRFRSRVAPRSLQVALPVLLPAVIASVYLDRLARSGHDPFAPAFADARRRGRIRLMLAAYRGRY
jgi:phytoene synthase